MLHGFDNNLVGKVDIDDAKNAARKRALEQREIVNSWNETMGSMIQVNDEKGPVFEAKWTGPEIVANQRADGAGVEFAKTTLFMTDILFVGLIGLGLGFGGALIYKIIRR